MTSAAQPLASRADANVLRWVHVPQQVRTREGLARLLEAAEELISASGYEETGIIDIAQRAGSSVGAFYRRFRDKDGVIQALHERFCEDARATADEALAPERWQDEPLAVVVHEFCAFLVRIHRERAGLLRAFLRHSLRDEAVRERSAALVRYLGERLTVLLETRRGEMSHPDPKLAAAFGLEIVLGTLDNIVQLRPHAIAISDERLVAEVSRAFGAYLGIEAPRSRLRTTARRRRPPR